MRPIAFLLLMFLSGCGNKTTSPDTVVALLPYKGIDADKVIETKKAIETYYGIQVQILDAKVLPQEAFINVKSPRYRADSLIHIQNCMIPDGTDYILGLTERDISVTKRGTNGKIKSPEWKYADFGIMGLAYCPGKSAIVSNFRLKHKDKAVQFGRFKKVVIHELGHNFGLPHCPDKSCVMTDAVESIKTIDNARPGLCNICLSKFQ